MFYKVHCGIYSKGLSTDGKGSEDTEPKIFHRFAATTMERKG